MIYVYIYTVGVILGAIYAISISTWKDIGFHLFVVAIWPALILIVPMCFLMDRYETFQEYIKTHADDPILKMPVREDKPEVDTLLRPR